MLNCEEQIASLVSLTKKLAYLKANIAWIKCVDKNASSPSYKQAKSHILITENAINKDKKSLKNILNKAILERLEFNLKQVFLMELNKCESEIELRQRPPHVVFDKTAVYNHTGSNIPEDVLMTVSWGRKFIFPYDPSNQNLHYYLAELECTLDNAIPIATKDFVARELSKEIEKIAQFQHDPKIQWLNFLKYRTQAYLDQNKHLKIIDSDKGACTMVIDMSDYDTKVSQFINSTPHIILLEENPMKTSITIETQFINILKANPTTKHLVQKYEPNTLNIAKFYGTMKHHKLNCPLRPIIATIGSPGYTLGKAFNTILTEIFPLSLRHINCINKFKKEIDTLEIGANDRLVSFDVISMYTNIPPDVVIQIISRKIKTFKTNYDLNAGLVLRILAFLLKEINFFETKDGKIYKMESGLPMGGPVSAIASRLIIDDIFNSTFDLIGEPIYHRVYVDDSIFIINKDRIDAMLLTLNQHTKSMQFTIENESNNQLNFLNMTLIRDTNKVITNRFKKPFSSNRTLNFYSAHKRSTIVNTAAQHIKTIIELSDGRFFHQNKQKVIDTLRNNNFPETLIICLMNQYYTLMRPLHNQKQATNHTYISYPHTINNAKLKTIIREFAHPGIILSESVKNTKFNFTKKLKKPTQYEERGNVIVAATCNCREKIKITHTKFNENGQMLIDRVKTPFSQCNVTHAFSNTKLHRGMHYRGQSEHLTRQLRWRHRGKLIEATDFPNKHFRH